MKLYAVIFFAAIAFFCGLQFKSHRTVISALTAAEACRDCPFPFRVDEYRWRMPSGKIEFELVESSLQNGRSIVYVTLYENSSTRIIATGSEIIPDGSEEFLVTLWDADGNSILADFTWADRDAGRLQAGFSCQKCRLKNMLIELRH